MWFLNFKLSPFVKRELKLSLMFLSVMVFGGLFATFVIGIVLIIIVCYSIGLMNAY